MRRGVFVLRALAQDLARPLEPGQGFRELRADGHDLEHGGDQEPEEDGVGEEAPHREVAGEDLARSHEHHRGAHEAQQRASRTGSATEVAVSVLSTFVEESAPLPR